jgi:hypothetical protein
LICQRDGRLALLCQQVALRLDLAGEIPAGLALLEVGGRGREQCQEREHGEQPRRQVAEIPLERGLRWQGGHAGPEQ